MPEKLPFSLPREANLIKIQIFNAIAGPESTQICAILLISNLRNLQYLASLSIPMPQFEVLATSVYLAP